MVAILEPSRPRASPMPTLRKPGESRTARWPGEANQRRIVRRGWAFQPECQAIVSPLRPSDAWAKKSPRIIRRAQRWDPRLRRADTASGRRPCARLTSFSESIATAAAPAEAEGAGRSRAALVQAQTSNAEMRGKASLLSNGLRG